MFDQNLVFYVRSYFDDCSIIEDINIKLRIHIIIKIKKNAIHR
jgi:hypothetical protein